ncbi:hypothetical protein DPMN_182158 [Dreissena polymorpha]|uniref:Uncharacterized protein n=1 Tax=Dreissena polymorpha TaxID=45954 RepID=A0A9D4I4E6_DREPO|nr:hypothetical protein DPMN_182158 [Dreissena polymorpha]
MDVMKLDIRTQLNATQFQITNVEKDISVILYNKSDFLARIDTLENTLADLNSNVDVIKIDSDKTRMNVMTVEKETANTQRSTHSLMSRVDVIERAQGDLKSKTGVVETKVATIQGQVPRLQDIKGW